MSRSRLPRRRPSKGTSLERAVKKVAAEMAAEKEQLKEELKGQATTKKRRLKEEAAHQAKEAAVKKVAAAHCAQFSLPLALAHAILMAILRIEVNTLTTVSWEFLSCGASIATRKNLLLVTIACNYWLACVRDVYIL